MQLSSTAKNENEIAPIPTTNIDTDNYFREMRSLINSRLQVHVPIPELPSLLVDSAMRYAVEGGHRWKPLLLISSYEAITGRDGGEVIDAACAMELIHCCTIVLDDLPSADNSDLRRGNPACHKVYGEAITIYASHLLFALAEQLTFSNAQSFGLREAPFRSHLYELRRRLVDSQVLEINLNRHSVPATDITLGTLYELKASLFTSTAWLGSTLARMETNAINCLREYGEYLGMAYQLADDIIDVTGKPEEIGKPVGMDKSKVNLVTVYGVDRARELAKNYWCRAVDCLAPVRGNTSMLREIGSRILNLSQPCSKV